MLVVAQNCKESARPGRRLQNRRDSSSALLPSDTSLHFVLVNEQKTARKFRHLSTAAAAAARAHKRQPNVPRERTSMRFYAELNIALFALHSALHSRRRRLPLAQFSLRRSHGGEGDPAAPEAIAPKFSPRLVGPFGAGGAARLLPPLPSGRSSPPSLARGRQSLPCRWKESWQRRRHHSAACK